MLAKWQAGLDNQYSTNCRRLNMKMDVSPGVKGPWEEKLWGYGNPVLGICGGHCGNLSEHAEAPTLLIAKEQARDSAGTTPTTTSRS